MSAPTETPVPRRRSAFGAAALLALLVTGCAPLAVQTQYDEGTDFSAYRTWGWLPEPAPTGHRRADDEVLHRLIREAIESQLSSAGFVSSADPQLRVGYHVSIETKVEVRNVGSSAAYPYYGGRGGEVQIRGAATTRIDEYERGTLVIDVVDAERRTLLWRGVGERRLDREPTREQMADRVHKAVAEILGRFPPGGAS